MKIFNIAKGIRPVWLTPVALVAGLLAGSAGAAGTFDGTYSGDVPNGQNLSAHYNCVAVPNWRIVVTNGTAVTRFAGPVSGPVAADGSFSYTSAGVSFTGSFAGGTFTGKAANAACVYSLALTRK